MSDSSEDPAVPVAARSEDSSSFQAHMRAARSDFEHAQDRINARTGRNLLLATAIGLGLGVVVLSTLLWVPWLFPFFALAACLLGVFEFSRALQASGRRIDIAAQFVATVAIIASGAYLDAYAHWVVTFAAVTVVVVWRLVAQMASADGRRYAEVIGDVLAGALTQLYVVFLASLALILLRQESGPWWVLTMIVVVVASDTGAYASGLTFGAHPMAPRISPKKTWEGFAGAVVFALVAAVLMGVFGLHLPIWASVVVGVAIVCCATVGDLAESMIKRDLGIKDMSSWLPGHGGVLDRLDSILFSGAITLALSFVLTPLAIP